MRKILLPGLIIMMFVFTGCATEVIRKQPTEVVDFSGRWNDTDARMTAEEMIKQCLDSAWVGAFNKTKGRDPVVIIGTVVNRSHEHINADVFVDDLATALTNSGKVRFVAAKGERDEVREERADQQMNSAVESRAQMIRETGADYMLKGVVNSVKDETKGKYAILFQVNLELIDMTTNEKVWIGQKKIKKVVKNPEYSM
ncbi:MAG: penicillin-binding protein activator LpoB [Candidatus Omnitrophica bacterium]|nr:penicillin-binding protein activator LpoB [Candidatus Omnitrophota bacterium]